MDELEEYDKVESDKKMKELQQQNEIFKAKLVQMANEYKKLQSVNEELKQKNEIIEQNISSLLLTATEEIARKDSTLRELQAELDRFHLRKHGYYSNDESDEYEQQQNVLFPKVDNIIDPTGFQIKQEKDLSIQTSDEAVDFFKPPQDPCCSRSVFGDTTYQPAYEYRDDPYNMDFNEHSNGGGWRYMTDDPNFDNSMFRNRGLPLHRNEELKKRSGTRTKDRYHNRKNSTFPYCDRNQEPR